MLHVSCQELDIPRYIKCIKMRNIHCIFQVSWLMGLYDEWDPRSLGSFSLLLYVRISVAPLIIITPRSQHNGITMTAAKIQRERDWFFFFWVNKNSTIIYFLKGAASWSLAVAGGSLRVQQLRVSEFSGLDSALFRFLSFYTSHSNPLTLPSSSWQLFFSSLSVKTSVVLSEIHKKQRLGKKI